MITVMACGCFDILHYGHLRHLRAAKSLGDRLVVVLTASKYVNKGPGRPIFSDAQRAEMLLALRCVDEVIINDHDGPEPLIAKIRPDIYVKGMEYRGRLREQELVESLGGRVVFTDGPVYSSSELVNKL